jgi:inner membrane protein
MNRTTHLIFAFLLFSLLFNKVEINIGLAGIIAFGTLFPDFDLRPRKWHRKSLHNVWILMLSCGVIYYFLSPLYVSFFAVGFVSHIIMDMLNPTGVWLGWPISRKSFRISRKFTIPTGSSAEYLLMGVLLAIGIILFL